MGDTKACLSISRAAGTYLVTAIDNMAAELAVRLVELIIVDIFYFYILLVIRVTFNKKQIPCSKRKLVKLLCCIIFFNFIVAL